MNYDDKFWSESYPNKLLLPFPLKRRTLWGRIRYMITHFNIIVKFPWQLIWFMLRGGK